MIENTKNKQMVLSGNCSFFERLKKLLLLYEFSVFYVFQNKKIIIILETKHVLSFFFC